MKAVVFARIFDEHGFASVEFESAIEAGAFAKRVGRVIDALQNENGRVSMLQVEERRMVQEPFRMIVGKAPEPFVVGRAALGVEFGDEIHHAGAGNSAFEAVGLRDGPFGHVAAV